MMRGWISSEDVFHIVPLRRDRGSLAGGCGIEGEVPT